MLKIYVNYKKLFNIIIKFDSIGQPSCPEFSSSIGLKPSRMGFVLTWPRWFALTWSRWLGESKNNSDGW
jgi:hypothetical protein